MHTVNALKQAEPSQTDSSRDAWLCFELCIPLCAPNFMRRTNQMINTLCKWRIRVPSNKMPLIYTTFQVNDHFVAHFRVNPIPIECMHRTLHDHCNLNNLLRQSDLIRSVTTVNEWKVTIKNHSEWSINSEAPNENRSQICFKQRFASGATNYNQVEYAKLMNGIFIFRCLQHSLCMTCVIEGKFHFIIKWYPKGRNKYHF